MKTLTGHLTSRDKKAIKAIIIQGLMAGKVGRKTYIINNHDLSTGIYSVKILVKDRGLISCGGSELRISTYTHTFKF